MKSKTYLVSISILFVLTVILYSCAPAVLPVDPSVSEYDVERFSVTTISNGSFSVVHRIVDDEYGYICYTPTGGGSGIWCDKLEKE